MTYIIDLHDPEILLILEKFASLNLLTINKISENKSKESTTITKDEAVITELNSLMTDLSAWANESHLSILQKSARTRLLPNIYKHRMASKPNILTLAGSISKTAAVRMLQNIEQLREEWD